MIKLSYIVRENPYFAAKLLHLIAVKTSFDEKMADAAEAQKSKTVA